LTAINLANYLKILEEAPSSLDIIVFPESTLNVLLQAIEIPEPTELSSPCDDENYPRDGILSTISCSAKKYNRYIVINIITRVKCPDKEMLENEDPRNCSENGYSNYNTNVVFNRNGTIISRYRKYHLFGERVDRPYKPQTATFQTDFGVIFGHFVCFDIMFKEPALTLVRDMKVTDIIFTSMWFSELPFLTAIQQQQGWAHTNDINLLAAGSNRPIVGSTGSGIYAGKRGALTAGIYGSDATILLTAKVPKKGFKENDDFEFDRKIVKFSKHEMKGLSMLRDQLDPYYIYFIPNTDSNVSEKLCRKNLCCEFNLKYTVSKAFGSHYEYAIASFHGNRTFSGFVNGSTVVCAIIACPTRNPLSCGTRDESLENIHFWDKIEIKGQFSTKDGQFIYFPTTVDTSILPLQPDQFSYTTVPLSREITEITMGLDENINDILTFGIYGCDFGANLSGKNENGRETFWGIFHKVLKWFLNLFH
jgi:pantetheine hydrolase